MSNVLHLTTLNELENALTEHKVAVVDFTASWCPPCKMIGPVAEQYAGSKGVKLIKIDIDQAKDLSRQFGVTGVPAFFLMQGHTSNIIDKFTGANMQSLEMMFAVGASLL